MFNSYKDKLRYSIRRENSLNPSSAKGVINKVYPETMTCDVLMIENSDSRLGSLFRGLPLPIVGGLSYSLPHAGDIVFLSFLNNNSQYPYIISVYTSNILQLKSLTNVESSTLKHITDIR